MMQEFERHFSRIQASILASQYDSRVQDICKCENGPAVYQCTKCFQSEPSCSTCMLQSHCPLPFHRIERWNGSYFDKTTLDTLGHTLFLGHSGLRCPNSNLSSRGWPLVVVHTNGIHRVHTQFCHCINHREDPYQLLAASLFPATMDHPETVFTFAVLKEFHAHMLASKKSAYDYFIALRHLTNGAFPDHSPVGIMLICAIHY